MTATVRDLGTRVDTLERAGDEARGAAREGARIYGRVIAVVSVLGMIGQLAVAYLGHKVGVHP